jgi:hypothetical protein
MPSITVGKENSANVDLHYKRTGAPVSLLSIEAATINADILKFIES